MTNSRLVTCGVGLAAAAWVVAFMTARGYRHQPPYAEEANIAFHLTQGHGFRSPMDLSPTAPPTAWSPPIYPLVIAAAYTMFGMQSPAALTMLMLVNAFCFGAIAAGMHQLAWLLFRSHLPGLLAAGLLACHPLFLFHMGDFWDGMISLAMFMWLTVVAIRSGMAAEIDGRAGLAAAVGLGASMGILALTNTSYGLAYPLLVLVAFPRRLSVTRWRLAATTLAAFLLTLAPWTVRNYLAFDRLVAIRTVGGVLFWLGNPPVSEGWLDMAAYEFHPYVDPDERSALLRMGEPAYDSAAFARFLRNASKDPFGYVARCGRRIVYLLVGEPTLPVPYPLIANVRWRGLVLDNLLLNSAVAALGLAGMSAAWRLGYRQWRLPALALCVALPFIPTAVIDRYSIPLRCLLLFYAGALLWMLASRLGRRLFTGPLAPFRQRTGS